MQEKMTTIKILMAIFVGCGFFAGIGAGFIFRAFKMEHRLKLSALTKTSLLLCVLFGGSIVGLASVERATLGVVITLGIITFFATELAAYLGIHLGLGNE